MLSPVSHAVPTVWSDSGDGSSAILSCHLLHHHLLGGHESRSYVQKRSIRLRELAISSSGAVITVDPYGTRIRRRC
jgi:hypothetical protein